MSTTQETPLRTDRPPKRTSGGWRTDIQGLRAVAVGLVILAHAGLPYVEGGFVGVDVFFVLSGFLITTLLLREADTTGRVSLVGFYSRRARRILPAATLVLVAVLAYGAVALPQVRLEETVADAAWSAVFLANWHFADVGTDYFAAADHSLLQHYWSLAVEEQFYLVWPLLALVLLPRVSRRVFTVVTAVGLVASLAWALHVTAANPTAAYFSTPARAYELAAGALLACLGGVVLGARFRTAAGLLGVALLAAATFGFGPGAEFPGWQALVPTLGTVALLMAGPYALTGRVLSRQPLRYLGDISFSLYLWHWPVLMVLPPALPDSWPGSVRLLLTGLVILGLSSASYHLVERPFQHKRVPVLSHGHRSLVLWPLALGLVLGGGWAANAYAAHQVEQQQREAQAWFERHGAALTDDSGVPRVRRELLAALDLADQGAPVPPSIDPTTLGEEDTWNQYADDCYARMGEEAPTKDCTFGDPKSDTTVALVGDSHAAMWLAALDRIGRDQGFAVKLYAKISCAHYPVVQPAKGMTQEECDGFRAWTLDQLAELRPDTILVTARGKLFMRERDGVSVDEQWSDAVTRTIDDLTGISADVRLLGDVPTRQRPDVCLSEPDVTQADCVVEPSGHEVDSNELTEAAVEGTPARYVDMQRFVCAEGRCPLIVGETVLYQDDSHVSRAWAAHVAPRLGKVLAPLPRS